MKKITVFFIVLALCCSSVFCLPTRKASSEATPEPAQPAEELSQSNSVEMLTEATSESESSWKELQTKIDDKFVVTGKTLQEIKDAFVVLGDDIEALKADNRNLNDMLDQATGTKFMGEISLLFGYRGEACFGGGASLGFRIKDGFILKAGVAYMGIKASEIKALDIAFDPEAIQANLTFGWEW